MQVLCRRTFLARSKAGVRIQLAVRNRERCRSEERRGRRSRLPQRIFHERGGRHRHGARSASDAVSTDGDETWRTAARLTLGSRSGEHSSFWKRCLLRYGGSCPSGRASPSNASSRRPEVLHPLQQVPVGDAGRTEEDIVDAQRRFFAICRMFSIRAVMSIVRDIAGLGRRQCSRPRAQHESSLEASGG